MDKKERVELRAYLVETEDLDTSPCTWKGAIALLDKVDDLEEKWWGCMRALYQILEGTMAFEEAHNYLEPEVYEHDYRNERG